MAVWEERAWPALARGWPGPEDKHPVPADPWVLDSPGFAAGGRKEVVDAERLLHSPSWCCREWRAGYGPAEPWGQPCTMMAFVLLSLMHRGTRMGQPWLGRQKPRPSGAGLEWCSWPERMSPCSSPCHVVAKAALALGSSPVSHWLLGSGSSAQPEGLAILQHHPGPAAP